MKKGLLLMLALFMVVSTVEAKTGNKVHHRLDRTISIKQKPIEFVEKGIKFSVMPNGKFRFTKIGSAHSNKKYRKNKKYRRNVKVLRGHKGRIKKVGSIKIYYNRKGKIKKIGSVDFSYKRGRLKTVGNLHLVYTRHGKVKYFGKVKNNWPVYRGKRLVVFS